MGALVATKEASVELSHKTPLKGEILLDDPRRPDRKNIGFPPGRQAIKLSVPQASHDTDKKQTPFVYHHNGKEAESKLPKVFTAINTETGTEEYVVDFEQGRRDVEFTISPETSLTINLIGVNGRLRGSMRVEAGSDEEVIVCAEGVRNRWLKLKTGIAAEVHLRGYDQKTDDELRLVIGDGGFVEQLHFYDNSAAETPDVERVGEFIGEIHVHAAAWLDNIDVRPEHTLQDMPARIALGRKVSRRVVDADTFHQGTALERREYDDPQEYAAALAAAEEAERRRLYVLPVLESRRAAALDAEARYLQSNPPQAMNERRWSLFPNLRRSPKDSEQSPVESHRSLITVDTYKRYLYSIVEHTFHKAMVDYTDEDMRIALALAHILTPVDQRPPHGKTAKIVGEEGLRIIAERAKYEAVNKAIDQFLYRGDVASPRVVHVSELAQRTADGWDVISEIDSVLLQQAEKEALLSKVDEKRNSVPKSVFVAPTYGEGNVTLPRRDLVTVG